MEEKITENSWHYRNSRAREERDNPTKDIFSTLEIKYSKKKRGANSPESEIRELMANLLKTTIPRICGRTKGWTKDELYQAYNTAIKWKTNPPALLQKLIKEKNDEIKRQLKNTLNKYENK